MDLTKLDFVDEGKSKKIYTDGECLYLKFKGDARCSAHDEQFDDDIGILRAKTSHIIFMMLKKQFNKAIADSEYMYPNIVKTELTVPLPLEVIPRYVAAGSVVKRFGFPEGYIFNRPILKIDYKTNEDDYLISDDLILEKNIVNPMQLDELKFLSLNIANY